MSYGGKADTSDEAAQINKLLQSVGPNGTIKFDPARLMTIRGRIVPLEGQELIDINLKQHDQAYTVSISLATPAVCTAPAGARVPLLGEPCTFFGAVPAGLTANTTYYAYGISGQTFSVATSYANAIAGTGVATSASGSCTFTQGVSAITATVNTSDTSCVVANSDIFKIGDSVTLLDVADVPGKFSFTTLTITKIVQSTKTITFDRAANIITTAGVPTSLTSGFLVLGGPLIGNRYEMGDLVAANKSIHKNIKITRPIIEGNKSNQTYGFWWQLTADIDLVCNNAEIYKPTIANCRAEGIMFSGSNVLITLPDIRNC